MYVFLILLFKESFCEDFQLQQDNFIIGINKLLGNKKDRNIFESIHYFELSSESGNGYASYLLGTLYQNSEHMFTLL